MGKFLKRESVKSHLLRTQVRSQLKSAIEFQDIFKSFHVKFMKKAIKKPEIVSKQVQNLLIMNSHDSITEGVI